MKRLILAGLVALGAWGILAVAPAPATADDPCANVRCMECPTGYHWAPKPNDCCRCLPD
ncbi:MAG TPA: hypothetical protein VJ725_06340 [Thermoanaerobaculia bacterium]|nr:hypothetical protein [Thermoanaerobaculia bacterium]